MIPVLQAISIGIFVFFIIYAVATLTRLAMSVRETSWYSRGQGPLANDGDSSRVARASAS